MKTREHFNPRAPCGARRQPLPLMPLMYYFNPRAPCGARRQRGQLDYHGRGFQPTRPLRGATSEDVVYHASRLFQPTRPLRGATSCARLRGHNRLTISTHAPLAGRDVWPKIESATAKAFQPTRPLRGATIYPQGTIPRQAFQPTRPLRGATRVFGLLDALSSYFNPRAPCGARLS